jgi:hypothetical protein
MSWIDGTDRQMTAAIWAGVNWIVFSLTIICYLWLMGFPVPDWVRSLPDIIYQILGIGVPWIPAGVAAYICSSSHTYRKVWAFVTVGVLLMTWLLIGLAFYLIHIIH